MNEIIQIGILIAISFVLIFAINKLFKKMYKKSNAIHLKYFNSLFNVIIIIVCIYSCLQIFELTKDAGKLLIQSGTLIIAVATFACQQALGNVISGFSISISKPYKVGDKITVKQGCDILAEGNVTDVTIRHTIITTFDGHEAIIPNQVMDACVIDNTTSADKVGNFIEIEVGYDVDIDKAKKILAEICIKHPLTKNTPDTPVRTLRYTANGVVLRTVVWTDTMQQNFTAADDIKTEIFKRFPKEGITIPYQTITISK